MKSETFESELALEVEVKQEEWEKITYIEVKSIPIPEATKTIPKDKSFYIDEKAKVGVIIAFKVNDVKVISGKIEEIHQDSFVVATKES